jgi:mannitol-1-phosphate/altronate dehydrogenase
MYQELQLDDPTRLLCGPVTQWYIEKETGLDSAVEETAAVFAGEVHHYAMRTSANRGQVLGQ